MSNNTAITGWVPTSIYKNEFGYSFYTVEGEIYLHGNKICTHAKVPLPECVCGFTSFAKREHAAFESGNQAIAEVEHGRQTLWTDGTMIRSLTQDIKKLHLSPECFDCLNEARTLTLVPSTRPISKMDLRVEVSCAEHAGDSGLFEPEVLSEALGVSVVFEATGRMADQLVLEEMAQVVREAEQKIGLETFADILRNPEQRSRLAAEIEYRGSEMLMVTLGLLNALSFDFIQENAGAIKELFERADPTLVRQFKADAAELAGTKLGLIASII